MTPITKEDRIRIIAQYWGQQILYVSPDAKVLQKIDGYFLSKIEYGDFKEPSILVTPLADISRDDMEKIMILKYGQKPKDWYYTVEALEQGSKVIIDMALAGLPVQQTIIDFFRANNYAIGYGPYPVEQLIKEGIFKLKI